MPSRPPITLRNFSGRLRSNNLKSLFFASFLILPCVQAWLDPHFMILEGESPNAPALISHAAFLSFTPILFALGAFFIIRHFCGSMTVTMTDAGISIDEESHLFAWKMRSRTRDFPRSGLTGIEFDDSDGGYDLMLQADWGTYLFGTSIDRKRLEQLRDQIRQWLHETPETAAIVKAPPVPIATPAAARDDTVACPQCRRPVRRGNAACVVCGTAIAGIDAHV